MMNLPKHYFEHKEKVTVKAASKDIIDVQELVVTAVKYT